MGGTKQPKPRNGNILQNKKSLRAAKPLSPWN